jgi:hypothetical protein
MLAVQDIVDGGAFALSNMLGSRQVDLVYSDPPWNPGNEKYWRNHAEASESTGYAAFLAAWVNCASLGIAKGARHVFTEQSANDEHRQLTVAAMEHAGCGVPLEQWTVYYGSPGSASVRRPNVLLHYGIERLPTDPSGMAGEAMTIRVCAGLSLPPGSLVLDPCMGKGMTSRMAHYFDWDCIGTEINAGRLSKTIGWLRGQGYVVIEE